MSVPMDGGPPPCPGSPDNGSPTGEAGLWQEAQDRVLLYLRKLGMPAIISLEVAHEALGRARQAAAGESSAKRPLALAMDAMHGLLVEDPRLLERTPYARYRVLYRRWFPEMASGLDPGRVPGNGAAREMSALPPINRQSMNMKRL